MSASDFECTSRGKKSGMEEVIQSALMEYLGSYKKLRIKIQNYKKNGTHNFLYGLIYHLHIDLFKSVNVYMCNRIKLQLTDNYRYQAGESTLFLVASSNLFKSLQTSR